MLNTFFTDKAQFRFNWYVTSQNAHLWAAEKFHEVYQVLLHSQKVGALYYEWVINPQHYPQLTHIFSRMRYIVPVHILRVFYCFLCYLNDIFVLVSIYHLDFKDKVIYLKLKAQYTTIYQLGVFLKEVLASYTCRSKTWQNKIILKHPSSQVLRDILIAQN